MKVSELAKQLEIENKVVIEALAKMGVEVKTGASRVPDETIEQVTKALSKKNKKTEAPKEEASKAAKPKKEATTKAAKEKASEASEPKVETPKEEEPKPAKEDAAKKPAKAPEKKAPSGEAPKKKKCIIFVSNNANSGGSGQRPQNNGARTQGPRLGQASSRPGANQVQHKIIKPITAPSAVEGTSDFRENSRKLDEARRQKERMQADETTQGRTSRPSGERPEGGRAKGSEAGNNGNNEAYSRPQNNNGGSRPDSRRPASDERIRSQDGRKNDRFRKDNQAGQPAINVNVPAPGKEDKRRNNKDQDKKSKKDHIYEDVEDSKAKKAGRFIKPEKKVEETVEEQIKVITIPETLTIKELADKMKLQPSAIIKKLFLQGKIVTVNTEVSYEDAENIAMEYEILCEKEVKVDVIEELLKEEDEVEENLVSRPPVICVMGHVDHGKTSLLDAIRKTKVTDKEAGGITQHIGAYTVDVNGQSITFLDTPGHEAFTAMRMRGANSTDIAILVVAADDGVMPQTVEAINHAKAAGIEIIVAVNKIDKPGANIDRVKQEMTEYELIPVDWGGTTEFVPVSAKTGQGLDDLLDTILLTAEIMELKANPNRLSRGLVIEAELDKGRGPVARFLVQKGTLHVGDFISAGSAYGKVRAMVDDKGRRVKEAKPSTPVEILGLSDVPSAGEVFVAHKNDKEAKHYAETYVAHDKEKKVEETKAKVSLDDIFNQIQAENLKELNIIVKADVQGSVEAVKQSLVKLSNEEVVVKCIHGGVGAINESDVVLASASAAIIIGFNIRPDAQAKALSEREGVEIRLYRVIYQAIEEIQAAMKGMLDPVYEEKIIGHAEVRQIFKASQVGNIAGSKVMDGYLERNCLVRITREGEQIYEGKLKSLKRFKDDVKEVKEGFECGLVFEDFDQMQELDMVEAYIMVEVPR